MIIHHPKIKPEKDNPSSGHISTRRLLISKKCKAEIIEHSRHLVRDLQPGEEVTAPVWSARDLLDRSLASEI